VTSIAVSDFQSRILLETGGVRPDRVIPWGVAAAEGTGGPRDIHVLGVGNLIPVKDPFAFVRIIARLVPHVPGLRACWAGGGGMEGAARELAQSLGIGGHMTFTGPLPREQVLCLMARARVLLHTAEFESFAMVMAEARAHGATVVSRPVGLAASATGPGFRTGVTEAGLADAVLAALSADPVPPTRPWPLEQSVDAYVGLYRELCP
jgi:glycosyltransferase involved in cell wall biosynthesis